MSLTSPTSPASTLAFVTTVHLAFAVLRNHRNPGSGRISSLAVVSGLFSASPWLLPSPTGLAVGLVVHTIWFLVCNRMVRGSAAAPAMRPAASVAAAAPAVSRPATSRDFVDTTVVAVMEEAKDIRTFRFTRPPGFEFQAGQFVPVRVSIAGRDHVRCYSISSAPESRGYLEISVKRQGLVSTALHTMIRPGSVLSIRTPGGGFVYPAGEDRPLLLLAGGIGITPLVSMMRHGVQAHPERSMTLLYSAPSADALAFREEIKLIVRRNAHANAIFAVTRGDSSPDVYPGRIDDSLILAAVPNVANAVAMMCGPQPMIDGMRQTLAALGVPPDRIRSEAFEAAVAAHSGRPTGDGRVHQVRCARSGTALHAESGQTLLEAAEAGGVCIDSLCRNGVCGTCRTRVVDGDVACESSALDDAERQGGYVLACVAHVESDCVIEA